LERRISKAQERRLLAVAAQVGERVAPQRATIEARAVREFQRALRRSDNVLVAVCVFTFIDPVLIPSPGSALPGGRRGMPRQQRTFPPRRAQPNDLHWQRLEADTGG
jgi:hypothetical protein